MSKYQTCAHSAPWLPPIPLDDEEKGYPVGRFCKHACGSMAVIRDPEVCESCTQYTDPAKLITINTGDYHADIYFDRLEDMPLSNIRKVFKLLLADPWSNEGAIRQMTLYLDAAVIESKEAWKQASIEYQNGWRNVFNKKSFNLFLQFILQDAKACKRKFQILKKFIVMAAVLWYDTEDRLEPLCV